MATSHQPRPAHDDIENLISRTGSIGGLERLAGVEQDHESRYAFWKDFAHLPTERSLDARVAELKRRIRANADSRPSTRR